MSKLDENGLSYGWYTDVVNNASGAVGSGNMAYRGILHVLMETHGITGGRNYYERRVMGQVSVATGILDYVYNNAETVRSVVRAQKQTIVDEGKTYEEVKALVGADNKGNDDVISAGCTITISDFIFAIEKAVKNAKDSKAVKDNTLKIGMISTATTKDASEEVKGSVGFDVSIALVATDKDGKVTAADSDVVSASFEFDTKGETSKDNAKVTSKKEAGANYGMASYGQDLNGDGTVKEWFEQADILDEKIIGKKADEITALAVDTGYGVEDVQKAGCTINIGDMVKAAVKACK